MKKEDLKIGRVYQSNNGSVAELVGFDRYNDPVLNPLNSIARKSHIMYSDDCELEDPACKDGTYGVRTSFFLYNYKPWVAK